MKINLQVKFIVRTIVLYKHKEIMKTDKELLESVEWLGKAESITHFFEYSIVTYVQEENDIRYYKPFINRENISRSYESYDEAIAGAIACKYEGCNHKADEYFIKSIKSN